ncbi:unnamed protein product [Clonostachys solani]|uniref:F-box domain-containing protein n=1 Tax=Clonostachys solani TaxID=160281 RepID=A0A9N9YZS3_9HYPO|nr:unnamed protein product [Clonostachys solani]
MDTFRLLVEAAEIMRQAAEDRGRPPPKSGASLPAEIINQMVPELDPISLMNLSGRSASNYLTSIPAETMNQMIPELDPISLMNLSGRSASNPLTDIPAEIMNQMIPELDPISLINLSQASQQFRHIIKPCKEELIERLLALECTEEFGGAEPSIHRRAWRPPSDVPIHRNIERYPSVVDTNWGAQRYACCGCLKLLPHYYFDNRSIQSEGLRKPMFGTPGAEFKTCWRPSKRGMHRQHVQGLRRAQRKELRLAESELQEGDPVLLQYTAAFKTLDLDYRRELNSRELKGVDDFSIDSWGRLLTPVNARTVIKMFTEVGRRGQNRRTRRCNECLYQRDLAIESATSDGDMLEIPTVKRSRLVHCGSALRRYFPGYSEIYGRECPPIPTLRMPSFVRWVRFQEMWNMCMIRCPGCEVWQEMRTFRLSGTLLGCGFEVKPDAGAGLADWDAMVLEPQMCGESVCNHCFVNKNGRDKLKQVLVRWLSHEQSQELARLEALIKVGWISLGDALSHPRFNSDPWVKLKKEHRRGLSGISPILDKNHQLNLSSMTVLRSWYEVLFRKDKTDAAETFATYFNPTRNWEYQWLINFPLLQSHWFHLTDMIQEVQADPERLVDWALEPRLGLPLHDADEAAFRQQAQ